MLISVISFYFLFFITCLASLFFCLVVWSLRSCLASLRSGRAVLRSRFGVAALGSGRFALVVQSCGLALGSLRSYPAVVRSGPWRRRRLFVLVQKHTPNPSQEGTERSENVQWTFLANGPDGAWAKCLTERSKNVQWTFLAIGPDGALEKRVKLSHLSSLITSLTQDCKTRAKRDCKTAG